MRPTQLSYETCRSWPSRHGSGSPDWEVREAYLADPSGYEIYMSTSQGDLTHEPPGGKIRIEDNDNPLDSPALDGVPDDSAREDLGAEIGASGDDDGSDDDEKKR